MLMSKHKSVEIAIYTDRVRRDKESHFLPTDLDERNLATGGAATGEYTKRQSLKAGDCFRHFKMPKATGSKSAPRTGRVSRWTSKKNGENFARSKCAIARLGKRSLGERNRRHAAGTRQTGQVAGTRQADSQAEGRQQTGRRHAGGTYGGRQQEACYQRLP